MKNIFKERGRKIKTVASRSVKRYNLLDRPSMTITQKVKEVSRCMMPPLQVSAEAKMLMVSRIVFCQVAIYRSSISSTSWMPFKVFWKIFTQNKTSPKSALSLGDLSRVLAHSLYLICSMSFRLINFKENRILCTGSFKISTGRISLSSLSRYSSSINTHSCSNINSNRYNYSRMSTSSSYSRRVQKSSRTHTSWDSLTNRCTTWAYCKSCNNNSKSNSFCKSHNSSNTKEVAYEARKQSRQFKGRDKVEDSWTLNN